MGSASPGLVRYQQRSILSSFLFSSVRRLTNEETARRRSLTRTNVSLAYLRKLVGQVGALVDRRGLGQQFARFRHQRGGDLGIEMRIAASLVDRRYRKSRTTTGLPEWRTCIAPGSASTSGSADFRNSATSFSLSGLASGGTYSATLDIVHACNGCLTRAVRMLPASGVSD